MIQPKTPKKIKGARKKRREEGKEKNRTKGSRRHWNIQEWRYTVYKARKIESTS